MRPCRHEQLRRSKRSRREHLGALLRLRPYRCRTCGTRVWRYGGRWYVDLPVLGALFAALYVVLPLLSEPAPAPRLAVQTAEATFPDLSAPGQAAPTPQTQSAAPVWPTPPASTPAPSPQPAALSAPVTPEPTAVARADTVPRILDLNHSARDGRFELHIRHNRDALRPKLGRLSSPHRLLLDLPGRWEISAEMLAPRPVSGGVVSRIRLGRHADKLRIVLDLQARPADIRHRLNTQVGEIRWTLAAGGG